MVDRDKAAHLAEVIAEQFPVPQEFLDEAVEVITRRPAPEDTAGAARPSSPRRALPADPADWPPSRDSMVRSILASATPDRDDRLFPGDIVQFGDGGGLGLQHGAAGVLLALDQTAGERYEEGERWLLRHIDPSPAGVPLGLYDGLAGVAHALDRLGHTQRALDLMGVILKERWQNLSSDLRGGLSGIGLVLDDLARSTGESELRERADEAVRLLAERIVAAAQSPDETRRAGLLRGSTGAALLFLRRHEHTGNPVLLDLASAALRLDTARLVTQENGNVEVDEGWRTMPYVGDGSVGIGMVLDEYLRHRPDEEFERFREGIATAARSRFYAQPGLLQGRAGMILHLSRTTAPQVRPEHLAVQVGGLSWYGMSYRDELAFPGHQMMRLSMDLGTGTAGCLLALGAAIGNQPAGLPFLPPMRPQ